MDTIHRGKVEVDDFIRCRKPTHQWVYSKGTEEYVMCCHLSSLEARGRIHHGYTDRAYPGEDASQIECKIAIESRWSWTLRIEQMTDRSRIGRWGGSLVRTLQILRHGARMKEEASGFCSLPVASRCLYAKEDERTVQMCWVEASLEPKHHACLNRRIYWPPWCCRFRVVFGIQGGQIMTSGTRKIRNIDSLALNCIILGHLNLQLDDVATMWVICNLKETS